MADQDPPRDQSTAEPRRIADRYDVVRVLGEGSSARTLLCTDVRTGGSVAIKELHFHHAESWKHLELFEREAKVLSMLDHPGVPKLHDSFHANTDTKTLYIVQELVEGVSLKQRMESGPMLGQQEIHELALGMLDVLDYLHGRAPPVLHRDIKPSNVIVRPDGRPVLVDFGGVVFGWRPPSVGGTTVVGTFGYMPPEQLVGQGGPTADLYALGATLLHVVTGMPPSDFPFDSGRIEIPPGLPIDEPLARMIEAVLRPAPRDRPQSAAAARRILVAPLPTHAGADTVPTGPQPTGHRHVTVVAVNGPRLVDMGDPPRDPRGEFRDVYRNLIHPLFPARRLWSAPMHALWFGLAGMTSVMTTGIAPAMYVWGALYRKRTYGHLFERGAFTQGRIRAVERGSGGVYATFKYEFEVAGSSYVAFMDYAVEMAKFWSEGDIVPVLYDRDDPSRCCFVYR